MPWHDYFCPRCGQVLTNVVVPAAIGQAAGAPDHCGARTTPIPGIGRMDVGAVKGAAFQAFETTDGRGQKVLVDSMHTLRRIERESEQAFRNGEGQPMVWRRWAQNKSNHDQPTLSKSYDPTPALDPAAKHRFGSTLRKSATEPEGRAFGPGVSEANASALPLEGKG